MVEKVTVGKPVGDWSYAEIIYSSTNNFHMFECLLFFSQMPTRTSFLFCFSFIQQFLLWYLFPCLLTVPLWPKVMIFPVWSAWKRHVHMNMESAVWAASAWGSDTHPVKNHVCPFHGSDKTYSSTELIAAWHEQWSLVSASSLFPDFILLASKY